MKTKNYYYNERGKRAIRKKRKKKGMIYILDKIFSKRNVTVVTLVTLCLMVNIRTSQLKYAQQDIQTKESIIQEINATKDDETNQRVELENKITQLEEDNQNLNNEKQQLNEQITSLTNDKTDAEKKLEESQTEISNYKKQINNLKKTSTTSRSSNSLTENQNEETKTTTDSEINSSDLDLMARIIYAEAGNCSDEEQLLVGNVVMNRVASKDYPNTIREVIYQKGQYSPTWNGAINKTPSEQAIKNAKRILSGERFCPTNVVYQAMFKQGSGVYKAIKNPDGTTYFCYK